MDKGSYTELPDVPWRVEYRKWKRDTKKKTDLPPSKHMCVMCGRNFIHFYTLMSHIRAEHKDISVFTCYRCHANFNNFNSLKTHVISHDKYMYKQHVTRQCKYCKWKVNSLTALDRHIARQHQPNFRCFKCECKFMTYGTLYAHTKSKHNIIPSEFVKFKCKKCERVFKPGRQCHSEVHTSRDNYSTGNLARPTGCKLCVLDYLSLISIASHKHIGETSDSVLLIECQKCFEEIDGFADLCRHRHEGELHRCLLCGETVQSAKLLGEHTKIHLEMTPLTCHVCYKTYESASLLSKHLCLHKNLFYEPFLCGVCLQSFHSTKSVRCHIKRHAINSELVNKHKCSESDFKLLDKGGALSANKYSSKWYSVVGELEPEKQNSQKPLGRDQNVDTDQNVDEDCILTDESNEYGGKCKSPVLSINKKLIKLNTLNVGYNWKRRQLLKKRKEECKSDNQIVSTFKVGRSRQCALTGIPCDTPKNTNLNRLNKKRKSVERSRLRVVKGQKGYSDWNFKRNFKLVSQNCESVNEEYINEYTLISVNKLSPLNEPSDKGSVVGCIGEENDEKESGTICDKKIGEQKIANVSDPRVTLEGDEAADNSDNSDCQIMENINSKSIVKDKSIVAKMRNVKSNSRKVEKEELGKMRLHKDTRDKQKCAKASKPMEKDAETSSDCDPLIIDLTKLGDINSTRAAANESKLVKNRKSKNNIKKLLIDTVGDNFKRKVDNVGKEINCEKEDIRASKHKLDKIKHEALRSVDHQYIDPMKMVVIETQLEKMQHSKPKRWKMSPRVDSCLNLRMSHNNNAPTKDSSVDKRMNGRLNSSIEQELETIDLTEEDYLDTNERTIDLTSDKLTKYSNPLKE